MYYAIHFHSLITVLSFLIELTVLIILILILILSSNLALTWSQTIT